MPRQQLVAVPLARLRADRPKPGSTARCVLDGTREGGLGSAPHSGATRECGGAAPVGSSCLRARGLPGSLLVPHCPEHISEENM